MSDVTQQSDHQQPQTVFVLCAHDRHILTSLLDNIPRLIKAQGRSATVLLYGILPKQRDGFLVIKADQGVPAPVVQRLKEGRDNNEIIDFVIYNNNRHEGVEA